MGGHSEAIGLVQFHTSIEPDADVVFLHGIRGDPRGTWTATNRFCWPEWTASVEPSFGVWSVRYPAPIFGHSYEVLTTAGMIITCLVQRGVGTRPLALVGHSLGGILAKAILLRASQPGGQGRIADNAMTLVTLGTPHGGSLFGLLATVMRPAGTSTILREIRPGSRILRLVADDLRARYDARAQARLPLLVNAGQEMVGYEAEALRAERKPT